MAHFFPINLEHLTAYQSTVCVRLIFFCSHRCCIGLKISLFLSIGKFINLFLFSGSFLAQSNSQYLSCRWTCDSIFFSFFLLRRQYTIFVDSIHFAVRSVNKFQIIILSRFSEFPSNETTSVAFSFNQQFLQQNKMTNHIIMFCIRRMQRRIKEIDKLRSKTSVCKLYSTFVSVCVSSVYISNIRE